MLSKISPVEIFDTNLTLNHDFWAIVFDMLKQLSSCHMLAVLAVTNIASKFRTIIHRVLMKLFHGHPHYHLFPILIAPMGEVTEVNTVLKDFVDFNQKVSRFIAIWAANIIPCIFRTLLTCCRPSLQLYLTVFANKLVAIFALQRVIRKLLTHAANDFLRHLPL